MLREARIVMPHFATPASIDAHQAMRNALLQAFGGYTVTIGCGVWFDGQEPVNDNVTIYDVAIEAARDASWDTLFQIAKQAGRDLGQQAVYIRYPDGTVRIEDVSPVQSTSEDANASPRLPLGARKVPQIGEMWRTGQDDLVAIVSASTKIGGGFNVVILQCGAGNTSWKPGATFVTDLDGCVLPDKSSHPRDLKRFIKNF